jgi:hypothetical protein
MTPKSVKREDVGRMSHVSIDLSCGIIDMMETRLIQLVEIEPMPDYRLRVRFSDGASGVADLSHLAGRGVFAVWHQSGAFERARIEEGRAVVWSDEVDLSADSLYLQVTGKSPEALEPLPKIAPLT